MCLENSATTVAGTAVQSLPVSVERCSAHTCLEGQACGLPPECPSAGGRLQESWPLGLWKRFCIRCALCQRPRSSLLPGCSKGHGVEPRSLKHQNCTLPPTVAASTTREVPASL